MWGNLKLSPNFEILVLFLDLVIQGDSQQLIQKYFLISSIKKHTVTCKVCQNFTDAGTFSYIYKQGYEVFIIISCTLMFL